MSQRRPDPTKWVWCVLVLSSGPAWSVSSVTAGNREKIPSIIEAQAKFFQDFFSVQLSPYKIEFGHVCEDPNTWEQRYEKKDFKNHRDMGKVRWGDKKGGYGEHYWDLNHAGHVGNHEEDEYDDEDYSEDLQDYPETGEKSNDDREEYYPDASEYERSARPKRENSKVELRALESERDSKETLRMKQKRSNMEPIQIRRHDIESPDNFDENFMRKSWKDNNKRYAGKYDKRTPHTPDNDHVVLVVDRKIKDFVKDNLRHAPYKDNAGARRFSREVSLPRFFLKSSTGQVIDTTTGQAYVVRPVHINNKYH